MMHKTPPPPSESFKKKSCEVLKSYLLHQLSLEEWKQELFFGGWIDEKLQ
jgi:hypothetical protein